MAAPSIDGQFRVVTGGVQPKPTASTGYSPFVDPATGASFADSVSLSGAGITDPVLLDRLLKWADSASAGLTEDQRMAFTYWVTHGSAIDAAGLALTQLVCQKVFQPSTIQAIGLTSADVMTIATQINASKITPGLSDIADQFRTESMRRNGITPQELRFREGLGMVNPNDVNIQQMLDDMTQSGLFRTGLTDGEYGAAVDAYVKSHFKYISDGVTVEGKPADHWNSVRETILAGGGDCEDLAVVTASLLMAALKRNGRSDHDVRDRVSIAAGYVSDASGAFKGHAVVKFNQINGQCMALDVTSKNGPKLFNSLNMDVVFEGNDIAFKEYQPIDDMFTTALNVTHGPDSIVSEIQDALDELKEYLNRDTTVPIPNADGRGYTYYDATSHSMKDVNDAMGKDIGYGASGDKDTANFGFFQLQRSRITSDGGAKDFGYVYLAKFHADYFYDYISATRDLINKTVMLFNLGNMYLEYEHNQAEELFLSGYDDNEKSEIMESMDSTSKSKSRFVNAMNNTVQKISTGVDTVLSEMFLFVGNNNSSQNAVMLAEIEKYGRENIATGIFSAIADEITGAFSHIRMTAKLNMTQQLALVNLDNAKNYAIYGKGFGTNISLWQSTGTDPAPSQYNNANGFYYLGAGAAAKIKSLKDEVDTAFQHGIQQMSDLDGHYGSKSADRNASMGINYTDSNNDTLDNARLFGKSGDNSQYMELSYNYILKLRDATVKYQNYLRSAYIIMDAMNNARRQLADQMSQSSGNQASSKSTSSTSQLKNVVNNGINAELSRQLSGILQMELSSRTLIDASNAYIKARFEYCRWIMDETQRLTGIASILAIQIASAVYGPAMAASMTAALTAAFSLVFDPVGGAIYGNLWGDYFSNAVPDLATSVVTVAMDGVKYSFENDLLHEMNTNVMVQQGDDYGWEANLQQLNTDKSTASQNKSSIQYSTNTYKYYGSQMNALLYDARSRYDAAGGSARISNSSINDAYHYNLVNSGNSDMTMTAYIDNDGAGKALFKGYAMASNQMGAYTDLAKVSLLMLTLKAVEDAMEEAVANMFGKSKSGIVSSFDAQVDAIVGKENSLLNAYRSENNARVATINSQYEKQKRIYSFRQELIKDSAILAIHGIRAATEALMLTPIPFGAAVAWPTYNGVEIGFKAAQAAVDATFTALDVWGEFGFQNINYDTIDQTTRSPADRSFKDKLDKANPDRYDTDKVSLATIKENLVTDYGIDFSKSLGDQTQFVRSMGAYAWMDQQESAALKTIRDPASLLTDENSMQGLAGDFKQVDYDKLISVFAKLTAILQMRTFMTMIDQAEYNAKQNALRAMFGGNAGGGFGEWSVMQSVIDRYSTSIVGNMSGDNGIFQDLVTEANNRMTSINDRVTGQLTKTLEQSVTLPVKILELVGIGFREYTKGARLGASAAADATYFQKMAHKATQASTVATMLGALAKIATGAAMYSMVRVNSPTVTSQLLNQNDSGKDPEDTENPNKAARKNFGLDEKTTTTQAGLKTRTDVSSKERASRDVTRAYRTLQVLQDTRLAESDAKQDMAEEMGGVQSAKNAYRAMNSILTLQQNFETKAVDMVFSAFQAANEAKNRGMEMMIQGTSSVIASGIAYVLKEHQFKRDQAERNAKAGGQGDGSMKNSSKLTPEKSDKSMLARAKRYVQSVFATPEKSDQSMWARTKRFFQSMFGTPEKSDQSMWARTKRYVQSMWARTKSFFQSMFAKPSPTAEKSDQSMLARTSRFMNTVTSNFTSTQIDSILSGLQPLIAIMLVQGIQAAVDPSSPGNMFTGYNGMSGLKNDDFFSENQELRQGGSDGKPEPPGKGSPSGAANAGSLGFLNTDQLETSMFAYTLVNLQANVQMNVYQDLGKLYADAGKQYAGKLKSGAKDIIAGKMNASRTAAENKEAVKLARTETKESLAKKLAQLNDSPMLSGKRSLTILGLTRVMAKNSVLDRNNNALRRLRDQVMVELMKDGAGSYGIAANSVKELKESQKEAEKAISGENQAKNTLDNAQKGLDSAKAALDTATANGQVTPQLLEGVQKAQQAVDASTKSYGEAQAKAKQAKDTMETNKKNVKTVSNDQLLAEIAGKIIDKGVGLDSSRADLDSQAKNIGRDGQTGADLLQSARGNSKDTGRGIEKFNALLASLDNASTNPDAVVDPSDRKALENHIEHLTKNQKELDLITTLASGSLPQMKALLKDAGASDATIDKFLKDNTGSRPFSGGTIWKSGGGGFSDKFLAMSDKEREVHLLERMKDAGIDTTKHDIRDIASTLSQVVKAGNFVDRLEAIAKSNNALENASIAMLLKKPDAPTADATPKIAGAGGGGSHDGPGDGPGGTSVVHDAPLLTQGPAHPAPGTGGGSSGGNDQPGDDKSNPPSDHQGELRVVHKAALNGSIEARAVAMSEMEAVTSKLAALGGQRQPNGKVAALDADLATKEALLAQTTIDLAVHETSHAELMGRTGGLEKAHKDAEASHLRIQDNDAYAQKRMGEIEQQQGEIRKALSALTPEVPVPDMSGHLANPDAALSDAKAAVESKTKAYADTHAKKQQTDAKLDAAKGRLKLLQGGENTITAQHIHESVDVSDLEAQISALENQNAAHAAENADLDKRKELETISATKAIVYVDQASGKLNIDGQQFDMLSAIVRNAAIVESSQDTPTYKTFLNQNTNTDYFSKLNADEKKALETTFGTIRSAKGVGALEKIVKMQVDGDRHVKGAGESFYLATMDGNVDSGKAQHAAIRLAVASRLMQLAEGSNSPDDTAKIAHMVSRMIGTNHDQDQDQNFAAFARIGFQTALKVGNVDLIHAFTKQAVSTAGSGHAIDKTATSALTSNVVMATFNKAAGGKTLQALNISKNDDFKAMMAGIAAIKEKSTIKVGATDEEIKNAKSAQTLTRTIYEHLAEKFEKPPRESNPALIANRHAILDMFTEVAGYRLYSKKDAHLELSTPPAPSGGFDQAKYDSNTASIATNNQAIAGLRAQIQSRQETAAKAAAEKQEKQRSDLQLNRAQQREVLKEIATLSGESLRLATVLVEQGTDKTAALENLRALKDRIVAETSEKGVANNAIASNQKREQDQKRLEGDLALLNSEHGQLAGRVRGTDESEKTLQAAIDALTKHGEALGNSGNRLSELRSKQATLVAEIAEIKQAKQVEQTIQKKADLKDALKRRALEKEQERLRGVVEGLDVHIAGETKWLEDHKESTLVAPPMTVMALGASGGGTQRPGGDGHGSPSGGGNGGLIQPPASKGDITPLSPLAPPVSGHSDLVAPPMSGPHSELIVPPITGGTPGGPSSGGVVQPPVAAKSVDNVRSVHHDIADSLHGLSNGLQHAIATQRRRELAAEVKGTSVNDIPGLSTREKNELQAILDSNGLNTRGSFSRMLTYIAEAPSAYRNWSRFTRNIDMAFDVSKINNLDAEGQKKLFATIKERLKLRSTDGVAKLALIKKGLTGEFATQRVGELKAKITFVPRSYDEYKEAASRHGTLNRVEPLLKQFETADAALKTKIDGQLRNFQESFRHNALSRDDLGYSSLLRRLFDEKGQRVKEADRRALIFGASRRGLDATGGYQAFAQLADEARGSDRFAERGKALGDAYSKTVQDFKAADERLEKGKREHIYTSAPRAKAVASAPYRAVKFLGSWAGEKMGWQASDQLKKIGEGLENGGDSIASAVGYAASKAGSLFYYDPTFIRDKGNFKSVQNIAKERRQNLDQMMIFEANFRSEVVDLLDRGESTRARFMVSAALNSTSGDRLVASMIQQLSSKDASYGEINAQRLKQLQDVMVPDASGVNTSFDSLGQFAKAWTKATENARFYNAPGTLESMPIQHGGVTVEKNTLWGAMKRSVPFVGFFNPDEPTDGGTSHHTGKLSSATVAQAMHNADPDRSWMSPFIDPFVFKDIHQMESKMAHDAVGALMALSPTQLGQLLGAMDQDTANSFVNSIGDANAKTLLTRLASQTTVNDMNNFLGAMNSNHVASPVSPDLGGVGSVVAANQHIAQTRQSSVVATEAKILVGLTLSRAMNELKDGGSGDFAAKLIAEPLRAHLSSLESAGVEKDQMSGLKTLLGDGLDAALSDDNRNTIRGLPPAPEIVDPAKIGLMVPTDTGVERGIQRLTRAMVVNGMDSSGMMSNHVAGYAIQRVEQIGNEIDAALTRPLIHSDVADGPISISGMLSMPKDPSEARNHAMQIGLYLDQLDSHNNDVQRHIDIEKTKVDEAGVTQQFITLKAEKQQVETTRDEFLKSVGRKKENIKSLAVTLAKNGDSDSYVALSQMVGKLQRAGATEVVAEMAVVIAKAQTNNSFSNFVDEQVNRSSVGKVTRANADLKSFSDAVKAAATAREKGVTGNNDGTVLTPPQTILSTPPLMREDEALLGRAERVAMLDKLATEFKSTPNLDTVLTALRDPTVSPKIARLIAEGIAVDSKAAVRLLSVIKQNAEPQIDRMLNLVADQIDRINDTARSSGSPKNPVSTDRIKALFSGKQDDADLFEKVKAAISQRTLAPQVVDLVREAKSDPAVGVKAVAVKLQGQSPDVARQVMRDLVASNRGTAVALMSDLVRLNPVHAGVVITGLGSNLAPKSTERLGVSDGIKELLTGLSTDYSPETPQSLRDSVRLELAAMDTMSRPDIPYNMSHSAITEHVILAESQRSSKFYNDVKSVKLDQFPDGPAKTALQDILNSSPHLAKPGDGQKSIMDAIRQFAALPEDQLHAVPDPFKELVADLHSKSSALTKGSMGEFIRTQLPELTNLNPELQPIVDTMKNAATFSAGLSELAGISAAGLDPHIKMLARLAKAEVDPIAFLNEHIENSGTDGAEKLIGDPQSRSRVIDLVKSGPLSPAALDTLLKMGSTVAALPTNSPKGLELSAAMSDLNTALLDQFKQDPVTFAAVGVAAAERVLDGIIGSKLEDIRVAAKTTSPEVAKLIGTLKGPNGEYNFLPFSDEEVTDIRKFVDDKIDKKFRYALNDAISFWQAAGSAVSQIDQFGTNYETDKAFIKNGGEQAIRAVMSRNVDGYKRFCAATPDESVISPTVSKDKAAFAAVNGLTLGAFLTDPTPSSERTSTIRGFARDPKTLPILQAELTRLSDPITVNTETVLSVINGASTIRTEIVNMIDSAEHLDATIELKAMHDALVSLNQLHSRRSDVSKGNIATLAQNIHDKQAKGVAYSADALALSSLLYQHGATRLEVPSTLDDMTSVQQLSHIYREVPGRLDPRGDVRRLIGTALLCEMGNLSKPDELFPTMDAKQKFQGTVKSLLESTQGFPVAGKRLTPASFEKFQSTFESAIRGSGANETTQRTQLAEISHKMDLLTNESVVKHLATSDLRLISDIISRESSPEEAARKTIEVNSILNDPALTRAIIGDLGPRDLTGANTGFWTTYFDTLRQSPSPIQGVGKEGQNPTGTEVNLLKSRLSHPQLLAAYGDLSDFHNFPQGDDSVITTPEQDTRRALISMLNRSDRNPDLREIATPLAGIINDAAPGNLAELESLIYSGRGISLLHRISHQEDGVSDKLADLVVNNALSDTASATLLNLDTIRNTLLAGINRDDFFNEFGIRLPDGIGRDKGYDGQRAGEPTAGKLITQTVLQNNARIRTWLFEVMPAEISKLNFNDLAMFLQESTKSDKFSSQINANPESVKMGGTETVESVVSDPVIPSGVSGSGGAEMVETGKTFLRNLSGENPTVALLGLDRDPTLRESVTAALIDLARTGEPDLLGKLFAKNPLGISMADHLNAKLSSEDKMAIDLLKHRFHNDAVRDIGKPSTLAGRVTEMEKLWDAHNDSEMFKSTGFNQILGNAQSFIVGHTPDTLLKELFNNNPIDSEFKKHLAANYMALSDDHALTLINSLSGDLATLQKVIDIAYQKTGKMPPRPGRAYDAYATIVLNRIGFTQFNKDGFLNKSLEDDHVIAVLKNNAIDYPETFHTAMDQFMANAIKYPDMRQSPRLHKVYAALLSQTSENPKSPVHINLGGVPGKIASEWTRSIHNVAQFTKSEFKAMVDSNTPQNAEPMFNALLKHGHLVEVPSPNVFGSKESDKVYFLTKSGIDALRERRTPAVTPNDPLEPIFSEFLNRNTAIDGALSRITVQEKMVEALANEGNASTVLDRLRMNQEGVAGRFTPTIGKTLGRFFQNLIYGNHRLDRTDVKLPDGVKAIPGVSTVTQFQLHALEAAVDSLRTGDSPIIQSLSVAEKSVFNKTTELFPNIQNGFGIVGAKNIGLSILDNIVKPHQKDDKLQSWPLTFGVAGARIAMSSATEAIGGVMPKRIQSIGNAISSTMASASNVVSTTMQTTSQNISDLADKTLPSPVVKTGRSVASGIAYIGSGIWNFNKIDTFEDMVKPDIIGHTMPTLTRYAEAVDTLVQSLPKNPTPEAIKSARADVLKAIEAYHSYSDIVMSVQQFSPQFGVEKSVSEIAGKELAEIAVKESAETAVNVRPGAQHFKQAAMSELKGRPDFQLQDRAEPFISGTMEAEFDQIHTNTLRNQPAENDQKKQDPPIQTSASSIVAAYTLSGISLTTIMNTASHYDQHVELGGNGMLSAIAKMDISTLVGASVTAAEHMIGDVSAKTKQIAQDLTVIRSRVPNASQNADWQNAMLMVCGGRLVDDLTPNTVAGRIASMVTKPEADGLDKTEINKLLTAKVVVNAELMAIRNAIRGDRQPVPTSGGSATTVLANAANLLDNAA